MHISFRLARRLLTTHFPTGMEYSRGGICCKNDSAASVRSRQLAAKTDALCPKGRGALALSEREARVGGRLRESASCRRVGNAACFCGRSHPCCTVSPPKYEKGLSLNATVPLYVAIPTDFLGSYRFKIFVSHPGYRPWNYQSFESPQSILRLRPLPLPYLLLCALRSLFQGETLY